MEPPAKESVRHEPGLFVQPGLKTLAFVRQNQLSAGIPNYGYDISKRSLSFRETVSYEFDEMCFRDSKLDSSVFDATMDALLLGQEGTVVVSGTNVKKQEELLTRARKFYQTQGDSTVLTVTLLSSLTERMQGGYTSGVVDPAPEAIRENTSVIDMPMRELRELVSQCIGRRSLWSNWYKHNFVRVQFSDGILSTLNLVFVVPMLCEISDSSDYSVWARAYDPATVEYRVAREVAALALEQPVLLVTEIARYEHPVRAQQCVKLVQRSQEMIACWPKAIQGEPHRWRSSSMIVVYTRFAAVIALSYLSLLMSILPVTILMAGVYFIV